jgi:hypothetical protein
MKWLISILVVTLGLELAAQTTAISVIENPVVSSLEEIQGKMSERQAVVDYQFVNIDLNALQNETSIYIDFFDVNEIIIRDRLERRSSESFSWFGFSEDKSTTVIFTVTGMVVNVSVLTEDENYKIETIHDVYVAERFDLSLTHDGNCTNGAPQQDETKTKAAFGDELRESNNAAEEGEVNGDYVQCKLRVLVLYTNKAKQKEPNIENQILNGMNELNLSFKNSYIGGRAELVYMGVIEYEEQVSDVHINNAGIEYVPESKNLNNFQGFGDGYMDDVHVLRDQYSADICLLIMDNPTRITNYSLTYKPFAGRVSKIRSSFSYAFAVVEYGRIGAPYFTFTHEIGHLFGVRHDNDPSNVIYPYGHGFTTGDEKYKTIMGVSRNSSRVLYWSGPSSNYQGYTLGNTSNSDNTLVILQNYERMMYLSTTNQVLTVYNSDVSVKWIKSIYAGGDMVTNGNIAIQWGRDYVFRAENSIELKSGFEIVGGAKFEALISPCGEEDFEQTDFKKGNINFTVNESNDLWFEEISVYPNPVNNMFSIDFKSKQIAEVSLELLSVNGERVKFWSLQGATPKNQILEFDIGDIPAGVYILQCFENKNIIGSVKLLKE